MKFSPRWLLPTLAASILGAGWCAYVSTETPVLAAPLPQGFPPLTAPDTIEIKQYPAYRGAAVRPVGEFGRATQTAFGPLFQHISSNGIGMTAPVEARYPQALLTDPTANREGEAEVSFLYETPDVSPEHLAPDVAIVDTPPMTVVSLGLRGAYDYDRFEVGVLRLREWLSAHPEYTVVGPPRRLLYDGPYTPSPLKRSEIQVPIAPVKP